MLQPGSTIGMLGSGQLGRMFALAARRLGYRVNVYSPDSDSPLGQMADVEFVANYDDLDQIREFARTVDVITYEFENVPAATAQAAEAIVPVRPGQAILEVAQHRVREKSSLRDLGLPVPKFEVIKSVEDLTRAVGVIGTPCVIKSATTGYDGKGQAVVKADSDLAAVWNSLGTKEAILEQFIEFETEFSMIGARGLDGSFTSYGPIENRHHNHILDVSLMPIAYPESARQTAEDALRTVMAKYDVVGVLCIEFFLTKTGNVIVNEIAPRPHNSGHLTIEACECSQFEQQLRAVCGLPLGSSRQHSPAAMANLLGDVWEQGEPDWAKSLENPSSFLHLYGKTDPRVGRKMGHLTYLDQSSEQAAIEVARLRAQIARQ
ncbi:5-(carboxyamino)imidazole ribonucleotide synthase [Lacunimicrobium album]